MNSYKISGLRSILAVFLEKARESRGFTRLEVAERLNVSEDIIEEWECGTRLLDLVELRAYCKAIDIPFNKCVAFIEAVFELLPYE